MFKGISVAQPVKGVFRARANETFRLVVLAAGFSVTLIYAATVIQDNVIKVYQNTSGSMEPTIHAGRLLLGSRLASSIHSVKRGDIVVVRFPNAFGRNAEEKRLLKRVIAVEGDTVEIKDGLLYLNGASLEERYIKAPMVYNMAPVRISEDHVFLMGDNRNRSRDSSVFGPLHKRWIEAKVKIVFSS